MYLNTGRIGPLLSDRLVIDNEETGIRSIHADHSLWGWFMRILSWICSPSSYSDENRRTIACVKKYLVDQVGQDRLTRVCARYHMNLEKMEERGNPLLSRDLAKIMVGSQDVKIEDIEELIEISKKVAQLWPENIPFDLRTPLSQAQNSDGLDSSIFSRAYQELSTVCNFGNEPGSDEPLINLPPLCEKMSGSEPTEVTARYFYDPFLADRERLILSKENDGDSYETFIHNFVARIIGREMEVGMLIPAPKLRLPIPDFAPEGNVNYIDKHGFYRVSAKIVSGEGMVSYVLMPATADSGLKPIRFYRGTQARPAAIDASSTMITDMEKELGRTAFESGRIYDQPLKDALGVIPHAAGHSLGSTTLEYAMIENEDIREAYFYNGPGIPKTEVEKFNLRMLKEESLPVKFIIRETNTDLFSTVGQEHLGFQAPDKVEIDYFKIFLRAKTLVGHAHVQVPEREDRYYGIEGGHDSAKLDDILSRKNISHNIIACTSNEALRQTIGPCIAAVIRFVRNFFRWICGARTLDQLGLQIGKFNENGKWAVTHQRPKDLLPLSENSEPTP